MENPSLKSTCPEVKPFIKWVGGKRQLLPEIRKYIPHNIAGKYVEPFLGGGAVFFDLGSKRPETCLLSDANKELVIAYRVVRDKPDELIELLNEHKENHSEFYYYKIRNMDRKMDSKLADMVFLASRFIYMNKTGFNGLYRVNKKGESNVPFGKKDEFKFSEKSIRDTSDYLSGVDINFLDFRDVYLSINSGDFVYIDPPYIPLKTTSFVSYTANGFDMNDQQDLVEFCRQITNLGARFLLSNSGAPVVYDLYQDFNIKEVLARRNINSKGDERGKVKEVLVTNY